MKDKITLDITGMSCTSCAQNIERTLIKQPYIDTASVNFANKKAYISIDKDVDKNEVIKLIKGIGYNAEFKDENKISLSTKKYKIEGMSCSSCALNIEKNLKKLDGVSNVTVNFADKSLNITFDNAKLNFQIFEKKVNEIGYELVEIQKSNDKEKDNLKKEKIRLFLAWLITLPLTVKMLGEMLFGFHIINQNIAFYIDLILAFPVIFVIGFPVIRSTFRSIIKFSFNMDSLIGIGTMAAYSTGIMKFFGLNLSSFVVVGAMIMSINFIGNYLKTAATGKASQAIKALLELGAKNAHLITDDGIEKDIPVENLKIDDVVLIKPGEKIPVDGVIIEGETSIDESLATGESIPVDKKINDNVIGATINQQGVLKVKIKKIGKDTFLSHIIKMVEEAQGSKVPIQAFADKVTSYFVPVVLVISILTFFFWIIFPSYGLKIASIFKMYLPWINLNASNISLALFASIATLVIACPCALGLATPTALMVGMGKGAQNGILIRNGEAIQTAKSLTTIIFDKTGTITEGKPTLNDFISNIDKNEYLSILGSIENISEHPLAKAVVYKVKEKNIKIKKIDNFKAVPGKGITAKFNKTEYTVGSLKYFDEKKLDYSEFRKTIDIYLNNGNTVILTAKKNKVIGAASISDKLKDDSANAIKILKKLKIKTVMLTGDNKKSAKSIAETVDIDDVYSELLPQDKIKIVKELQEKGEIVAMVGDGINDAPALKQSNVGIAIGTGTDIAIESADITLVSGSLMGVVKAIILSRATFNKIIQNLFWAFFYNIIAIPLALFGLLHPAIAEAAMALSSINVVGNSLRLKGTKLLK